MPLRFPLLILSALFGLTGNAPAGLFGSSPDAVDLSTEKWFPPITRQQSFSCSQQVALYYLFTAERNRALQQSSASPARRFSPYLAYSMLAGERTGRSHVVDGWILAREAGVPLEGDFPRYSRTLMHGYDRYLRAMKHRVKSWEILPVTDERGISRAKELLASGHPLACDFQIKGTLLRPLQTSGPRARERIVAQWGRTGPGHAMVYAGFDDSIGFDFNKDGRITNDVDLNGDGRISLIDHERGAFLVVNPWGGAWGDRGRAWVPYRQHAASRWPWSGSVARVEVAPPYQPRLTLRLKMRAPDRQNIIVTAGNGKGRTVQPWMFSHLPATGGNGTLWDSLTSLRTPGPHLSPGSLAAPDGGPLETGHDLSALGRSAGYSLEIRPARSGTLSCELVEATFLEYDTSGRLVRELPVTGFSAKLPVSGGQWLTAGGR
jgi:hypothetical protein